MAAGPQIATMLKRLGIQSEFAAGLASRRRHHRKSSKMVLAGSVNKQLVGYINEAGGKAVGFERQGRQHGKGVEDDAHHGRSGFQHREESISASSATRQGGSTLLNQLIGYELIPVLAPLATSHDARR